ncbi:facilitated trehalose transporter Tret1-like [Tenebrio molitor]|uniref:facilitated trehalose transporter Tret1-like n=1 Tax=Tenebrio molitor TaxID=7067 RepID=UPI0036247135
MSCIKKILVFNPSPPLFLQAPPTKTTRLTQDKTISTTSCSTECKCHPRGHKMFKLLSYTFLTVLTVDLLATSGDLAITWTSPVLAKLYSNDSAVNPFDQPITEDEDSWIGSLINIGAMIGPFPYGFLADKYGRKIGLLAVSVPYIVSYLTLAFSKTVYLYYFARLLGGIAIGGGYTLLPMYVAEIAADSNRGMLSASLNVFWTLGNLIPYAIGPYTSIVCFNAILACIPGVFFVLFFTIAPESPYYLVEKNDIIGAEKSLMKLRSRNKKVVENDIASIDLELKLNETKGSFLDLFRSRVYMKGLVISLVLVMAQQLSGINAVLFYTEEIFSASGAQETSPEMSSIITGLVVFLSSFATPFLSDRLGRRLLMLISLMGVFLSLMALSVFFYLRSSTDVDVTGISWLPLLSLIMFFVMYNFGIGPLPWTVSSELFPVSVKSYAASLVSCACWTTSFVVTKFFNDLNEDIGQGETFWLFGGFCLAAWLFTMFFVPETKGKSFQEIQEILERR